MITRYSLTESAYSYKIEMCCSGHSQASNYIRFTESDPVCAGIIKEGMNMPHLKHLLAVHLRFKKRLLQGLRDYDLMPGHPKIMYFLFNNEGCQQKDIARNCYVESATLSTVLSNMEKRGLIDRIPHKSDRRAYSIYPKKVPNARTRI